MLPGVIFSSIISALPGGFISIYVYDSIAFSEAPIVKSRVAIANTQHYTIETFLLLLLYCFLSSMLILILPSLAGSVITLLRSMKRSITDSIREIE